MAWGRGPLDGSVRPLGGEEGLEQWREPIKSADQLPIPEWCGEPMLLFQDLGLVI